jgi:hypothetical protein
MSGAADLARDQAVLDWARQVLRAHGHGICASCTPACLARAGAMPPDAVRADAPPGMPAGGPPQGSGESKPACCPHTPGGPHSLLCRNRRQPTLGERIAARLMCPACLLPRVVPGHRLRGCR